MDELKSRIGEELFQHVIKANIDSLQSILTSNETYLQEITSLSPDDVKKIIKEAGYLLLGRKICKASQVKEWERISTGCHSIDSICRGGVPIRGIVEIVGCSGVGKTQFCLQLSVMVQLHKDRSGVLYICTEDVFPSKRLMQLAEAFRSKHCTKTKFEDNIFVEHIADFEQLRRCLYVKIPRFLLVRSLNLIVIDSIAGIFRSENVDISYSNRSQDFVTIATQLRLLSKRHNIAIICTNQVTENIETGKTDPCLGLAWANLVSCRFVITRHNRDPSRDFEVVFAPDLPERKCSFLITEYGLVDM